MLLPPSEPVWIRLCAAPGTSSRSWTGRWTRRARRGAGFGQPCVDWIQSVSPGRGSRGLIEFPPRPWKPRAAASRRPVARSLIDQQCPACSRHLPSLRFNANGGAVGRARPGRQAWKKVVAAVPDAGRSVGEGRATTEARAWATELRNYKVFCCYVVE